MTIGTVDEVSQGGVWTYFHFIRASLPVYLAVFHEDDAISNAKHAAQLVGDDNIGDAVILLEAFDELVDALRSDRIKTGMRFIIADALGFNDDRTSKSDTLLHASR